MLAARSWNVWKIVSVVTLSSAQFPRALVGYNHLHLSNVDLDSTKIRPVDLSATNRSVHTTLWKSIVIARLSSCTTRDGAMWKGHPGRSIRWLKPLTGICGWGQRPDSIASMGLNSNLSSRNRDKALRNAILLHSSRHPMVDCGSAIGMGALVTSRVER